MAVSYEGPYSFVHDIHCELSTPLAVSYRLAAVRKFKQALQRCVDEFMLGKGSSFVCVAVISVVMVCVCVCVCVCCRFSSSDALVAHFLSFPTTPTHYTLPTSVVNGMPLFYFPPNQSKPAPSVNLDSSGGR